MSRFTQNGTAGGGSQTRKCRVFILGNEMGAASLSSTLSSDREIDFVTNAFELQVTQRNFRNREQAQSHAQNRDAGGVVCENGVANRIKS
jgi:hypothetical protein